MLQVSPWALSIPTQLVREISERVMGRDDVLRLEVGQPNFPTPEHIVEAGVSSVRAGSGYTYAAGTPELRAALAAHATEQTGVATAPEQIIVTQGGVQGVGLIMSLLVRAGDEVLVPDPAWPNFEMQVVLHGAACVSYPLHGTQGFQPDPDEIERLITPRTSLLILNSPGNPTGTNLPAETLVRIVELAAAHGIPVLSDEVYDALVFDGGEPANARRYDPDTVIALHSFSKTYAMTGWRVGWVVVPPALAQAAARAQEPALSCLPTFTQAGALAAITGPQGPLAAMKAAYQRRRDIAVQVLGDAGVPHVPPQGAFYLMVRLAAAADAYAATIDLIDQRQVAVSPGTGYGQRSAGYLRVSLASSDEDLAEGVRRIADWYAATEGGVLL